MAMTNMMGLSSLRNNFDPIAIGWCPGGWGIKKMNGCDESYSTVQFISGRHLTGEPRLK